jgi:hypothetical protein
MTDSSFWQEDQQRESDQSIRCPRRPPDRVWAGPATEATCAMCGDSTEKGEDEVEIEYDDDHGSGTQTFRLHARCFSIMERGHWSYE